MSVSIVELNSLAVMLAECLCNGLTADELKDLVKFVNLLQTAIKSYQ